MQKQDFNHDWTYKKEGESTFQKILIPHDAMIHERRDQDSKGGSGNGYFYGGKYIYEKSFDAPLEWNEKHIELEFEGIYRNSTVQINGQEVASHKYGYTPFSVTLDFYLHYGERNVITVYVDNSELPNSRWYTGSGIYRPMNLYIGEQEHIGFRGVRIQTKSVEPARILVETTVKLENSQNQNSSSELTIQVEISDHTGKVVARAEGSACEMNIPNAKLWSSSNPYLYTCKVRLWRDNDQLDEVTEQFGIREISWSNKGLLVNGENTLLRGGCIHHDNGILGAATWSKSEERRVRILKENGFNAIRMSHNPASDALVKACDIYGMYLIDETFDMWYVRKTKYDYGRDFKACWKEDVAAMVNRDYNHPSVIMYSIGNEVSEPGKPEGVEQGKEITSFIKNMDTSRAVTGGMNLMIMSNYAKGKGQYANVDEDAKTQKGSDDSKEPKNASLAFNMMAMMVGSGMNKAGNSKKVDEITTPMLDALDIAGYNYASGRYPMEEKQHPNRVIMGSETFPQDIYTNWTMVEKYPYLIGDFMWTSWDYLGEAGIGAWSYTGGMPFSRPYPWVLGGAGVIDILGNPDISCRNAQIVWKQLSRPVIGVRPLNHPGIRVSKSVWRGTNAMESWSWKNCEGNKSIVEVHTLEPVAELIINGKSVGKKKTKSGEAQFKVKYVPGEIEAVTYDESGKRTGNSKLQSASSRLKIGVHPEEATIQVGDIAYIPITIEDENGIVECNADTKITVSVKNGTLLALGNANPCTKESYDKENITTYYGRAQAIVYGDQAGTIEIQVQGEDLPVSEGGITVE